MERRAPKDAFLLGFCIYGVFDFTNIAIFKKYKYDLEIDLTPLKSKIDKGIVTKKEIDDVTEKQYEQVEKLMKNTGSPKSLKDAIKEAKKIKKAL